MSCIFVSYTHSCITPQISKFKARDDPGFLDLEKAFDRVPREVI